jgi:predicted secreted acid phosphatase
MHKKSLLIALSAACLAFSSLAAAKEPKNLNALKIQVIKYHDSGEYQNDQSKVIGQAMLYLKNRLANEAKSHSKKKLAIILDIDETSLSNYADMAKMDFGGTFDEVVLAEDVANDAVIKPTLELYRYAKENNVAIFFVTGRKEHSREATIKNLNNVGFKNWDGLILKSENYNEKSASPFKIGARESVEKQGYVIILNLGDQESDLAGKHAEKSFKLPNPYYFIP